MTTGEIEDLLLLISDKDSDKHGALAAFTTLYNRYKGFLASVVASGLKKIGIYDQQVLVTVINNSFCILYEKPLSFSFPTAATNDSSFKAWLSTIARNELKRLLKSYYDSSISLEIVQPDSLIESEDIEEEIFESVNLKTMNDALNTLPQRDREILLTLYLYYEEGKKTPSEVLDLLSKMHNTTKVNIRKIKSRSENKIIEFFSKHSSLKPLLDGR